MTSDGNSDRAAPLGRTAQVQCMIVNGAMTAAPIAKRASQNCGTARKRQAPDEEPRPDVAGQRQQHECHDPEARAQCAVQRGVAPEAQHCDQHHAPEHQRDDRHGGVPIGSPV